MLAIFKREFKSLFHNVIGFLFLGVLVCFFGIYMLYYNLYNGSPYITYALSSILLVLLITIPVLTMRSFAEERKNKTDQLLLTSPVSVTELVLGKFLSIAAVLMIYIAFLCIIPLILSGFGDVPFLESYVAIFGFAIFGIALIAIGVFVSSLTESTVLSAIFTFAALFIGYFMSSICNVLSSGGNIVTKILRAYDLYNPVISFYNGNFDIKSTVYYISITVVFLFLTVMSIQKRRYELKMNTISLSVFSGLSIIIVVAIAIFANLFVGALPTKYTTFDCTSEKLYSIGKDTLRYVNGLDQHVDIYVLADEDNCDNLVQKTLTKFNESKNVDVTYVNPTKNPKFAANYTSDNLSTNSLIVVSDLRSKTVDYSSLYVTEMDYQNYSYNTTGYDAEGQIVSAISYVMSEEMPVVYELTGHNEIPLAGGFTDAIQKSNYELRQLNLLAENAVPKDCDTLIINGAASDLSEDDLAKLEAYIKKGGNVVVSLLYENMDSLTNTKALLETQGIKAMDGLVADRSANNYYSSVFNLLPIEESTAMSFTNTGEYSVFAPDAIALDYDKEDDNFVTILSTSDDAIVKKDYTAQDITMDAVEGDTEGTFSIGVYCTTADGGYFTVFGSALIFTEQCDAMVSNRNSSLFSDVLSANIAAENEAAAPAIVVPAKNYEASRLTVSAGSIILYAALILLVIPLALVIDGIIVFAIRRKK